jgi:hypothetical protein
MLVEARIQAIRASEMRKRQDIIDSTMELERTVSHMETKAIPYYWDPREGLTTEWVDLAPASGWGGGTWNDLQWRICADHLAMCGSCRKTGSPGTLLFVLPEEVWPQDTVRRFVSCGKADFSHFSGNHVTIGLTGHVTLSSLANVVEVYAHPITYPVLLGG